MKTKYTKDEIKAIVDGTGIDVSAITDVDQYEVGRYYYDETTHEEKFRPYTMDEINAMLDRAEADMRQGAEYLTKKCGVRWKRILCTLWLKNRSGNLLRVSGRTAKL